MIVHPATDKHIAKYSDHERFVVEETEDLYNKVTLPHLEQQQFSLQVRCIPIRTKYILLIRWRIKKNQRKIVIFSYPSVLTIILGAQKTRPIETVLLITHNLMFWLRNKKKI